MQYGSQQLNYAPTASAFAIQETQVMQGNFSAQYGNAMGGVINQTSYQEEDELDPLNVVKASYRSNEANEPDPQMQYSVKPHPASSIPDETQQAKSTNSSSYRRKLSYYTTLNIEIDSARNVEQEVDVIVGALGGYMVSSNTGSMTFRVPVERNSECIKRIEQMGAVKFKNTSTQDITTAYYDLEVRMTNAESAMKRYRELLAKSNSVEDALKVERELERLGGEIESMKGRLAMMRELSSYSTITLGYTIANPSSSVRPGPLGYVFVGLYQGVKWLFVW